MDELINEKVFDNTKKFVDLKGLDYFWAKAKEYVDGLNTAMDARVDALETIDHNAYVAADKTVLASAKEYADGLNTAMNTRVEALEAIDHEKLASDASAAAVATVLDGAPEKFDTLKEIAAWIAEADTAEDAAGSAATAEQNAKS